MWTHGLSLERAAGQVSGRSRSFSGAVSVVGRTVCSQIVGGAEGSALQKERGACFLLNHTLPHAHSRHQRSSRPGPTTGHA